MAVVRSDSGANQWQKKIIFKNFEIVFTNRLSAAMGFA